MVETLSSPRFSWSLPSAQKVQGIKESKTGGKRVISHRDETKQADHHSRSRGRRFGWLEKECVLVQIESKPIIRSKSAKSNHFICQTKSTPYPSTQKSTDSGRCFLFAITPPNNGIARLIHTHGDRDPVCISPPKSSREETKLRPPPRLDNYHQPGDCTGRNDPSRTAPASCKRTYSNAA